MAFKDISAQELLELIKSDSVALIDVREPSEFAQGHLEGAQLSPLGQITPSDLPQTSKPLVLYCKVGGRSARACLKLASEGADQPLYNLIGGIEEWTALGYPIDTE